MKRPVGHQHFLLLFSWRSLLPTGEKTVSACCESQSYTSLDFQTENIGSVTITVETSTDGATTLSRINLSGHVGHATIFI